MLKLELRPRAQEILDIISRPWNNAGGGRSRRRRRGAMPEFGGTFDDVWINLPVKRLEVVGIRRQGNVFDVTMFFTDRFQYDPILLGRAFVFRVSADEDLHAAMAAQFNGWDWDSFAPPPSWDPA